MTFTAKEIRLADLVTDSGIATMDSDDLIMFDELLLETNTTMKEMIADNNMDMAQVSQFRINLVSGLRDELRNILPAEAQSYIHNS